jgi:hypothetical protein
MQLDCRFIDSTPSLNLNRPDLTGGVYARFNNLWLHLQKISLYCTLHSLAVII